MPIDNASSRAVPPRTPTAPTAQSATRAPTSASAATPAPAPRTVTVRSGDTLTGIAERHGVSLASVVERNPQIKDPDRIYPGQVVTLPPESASAGTQETPAAQPASPEVQRATRARSVAAEQAVAARLGTLPVGGTRLEAHVRSGGVLREGAKGPEVVDLQRFLGMKAADQDGVFGPKTRERVEAFQGNNRLAADGVVGPDTLKALKEQGSRVADARALASYVERGDLIKDGDIGDHVRGLQRKLGMSEAGQTGVYGPTTRAAVEEFQRKNLGMTPASEGYGTVGKTTVGALDAQVKAAEETATTQATGGAGPTQISARGQEQMRRLVDYARNNNVGGSNGDCFKYVWRYLHSSGYGKINNYNDLPRMQSGLARHFSDYMNASPANLREAGLQRLDTALSPPISNPHDSRIPAGAVIVVAAGSTGTAHPEAGDIVVKGGRAGEFINDGPAMYYGTPSNWRGKVLGVYVPE